MGENPADTAARHRLVRLAVLPAGAVAVIAAAAVAYVMRAEAGADAAGAPLGEISGIEVWAVLLGGLLLICAISVAAALAACAEHRRGLERVTELRRATARGEAELRVRLRSLEQGEPLRAGHRRPAPPEPRGDSLELLGHELAIAQHSAESYVADVVSLMRGNASDAADKVEVFVNLARRLQSLVHREIELIDELESEVEDPDLLKGLFHVDLLSTRIRRHAENLAVLGGEVPRRQWTRPVSMTEVLRSAIAEVEQYQRVKLAPPLQGTLRGHAVADVIHLLAELVENATVYSAPQTQVLLRVQYVTAGLAIEVEDRGLGMTVAEQNRMNAVLSDPDRVDLSELLYDGRIGLFVVSALARRHGIAVQLRSNIYGGVQAVLVLPPTLLGGRAGEAGESGEGREGGEAAESGSGSALAEGAQPGGGQAATRRQDPAGAPAGARAAGVGPGPTSGAAAGQPSASAAPSTGPSTGPSAGQGGAAPSSPAAKRALTGVGSPPPGASPGVRAPIPGQQRATDQSANGAPAAAGSAGAQGEPADGSRPRLPKRRRQQHIAPRLRESPPHLAGASDTTHDPGLMAAFQRGTSLAEQGTGGSAAGAAGGGADAAPGAQGTPDGSTLSEGEPPRSPATRPDAPPVR